MTTTTLESNTRFEEALFFLKSICLPEKEITKTKIFYHKCSDGSYRDVTGDGSVHPKMDDIHLVNTIRFWRRTYGYKQNRLVDLYIAEAKKRNLYYV